MSYIDAPEFVTGNREQDSTVPRFFMDTVPNKARSEKEGRPCFDDVEMVEILIPGDRNSVAVQMVADRHRQRWPRHYNAWKQNQDAPESGTPIDQLPGMTKAQIEELKFFHVKTIEALGELSDSMLTKVTAMGGNALREKAQRWLAATAGEVVSEKLAAENRELRANMDLMQTQMADMKVHLDRLQAQAGNQEG